LNDKVISVIGRQRGGKGISEEYISSIFRVEDQVKRGKPAETEANLIRRAADKSLDSPTRRTTKKDCFLDGLKKLEQRSHKCVELRGEYVE
jgi:hypothetical protein